MATHKDIDEILKGYLVSAFANAPEPEGSFVDFKGGEVYHTYFDIYVKSGNDEIPLKDFKMDWHSRFTRMTRNLEISKEALPELFERPPEYFEDIAINFPEDLKMAVVVWERMQRKIDSL